MPAGTVLVGPVYGPQLVADGLDGLPVLQVSTDVPHGLEPLPALPAGHGGHDQVITPPPSFVGQLYEHEFGAGGGCPAVVGELITNMDDGGMMNADCIVLTVGTVDTEVE